MEFTTEQIEKARACKTLDEFKSLAKAEGLEFSDEEVAEYFNATHSVELNDEDLSSVAGGKGGKWVEEDYRMRNISCPFCGAGFYFTYRKMRNEKTGDTKIIEKPEQCGCGAKITYFPTSESFQFKKNGEVRRLDY